MVRTYKRKTNRRNVCTEEVMIVAREKIAKGASICNVSLQLGIPVSTLRENLKRKTPALSCGRFQPIFSDELQQELVKYCLELDKRFTLKKLRKFAFELAEKNCLHHPFDKESGLAGIDWVYGFLRKHPELGLQTPESTSLANKVQVGRFYENLRNILEKYNFSPADIFNMDETGVSILPHQTPTVTSQKGKRAVNKIVSAEKGQTVTVICCYSAAGVYTPPYFVFPRMRMQKQLLDDCPPCSDGFVSESGSSNKDIFLLWLQHFKKNHRPSLENPCLLILDNHTSHMSLPAVDLCRESGIHMLSIPPHSRHKLQPLDVSFFSSLKSAYSSECDKWMTSNHGLPVTQYEVGGIFAAAYNRVTNVEKAVNGFRTCGICPYNPDVVLQEDYLPSSVTSPETLALNEEDNSVTTQSEVNADLPSTSSYVPPILFPEVIIDVVNANLPTTSTHVCPVQIRPYPKATNRTGEKRKSQSSNFITVSPFQHQLLPEKDSKLATKQSNRKRTTNSATEAKVPSTIQNTVEKRGTNNRVRAPPKPSQNQKTYTCPACNEPFTDPPFEDWIICPLCENWWHDQCTSYE